MLNVGESTVTRAKKIQRLGSPELVAAVESGELTVGASYKVAELPHDEQNKEDLLAIGRAKNAETVGRPAKESVLQNNTSIEEPRHSTRAEIAKLANVSPGKEVSKADQTDRGRENRNQLKPATGYARELRVNRRS